MKILTQTHTDLVDKTANPVGILRPKHVPHHANGFVAGLGRYSLTSSRTQRCCDCQHTARAFDVNNCILH